MVLDKVELEILHNRFSGIVGEMGRNIWRSSFTAFVKNSWDFGMGLVSLEGEIFAYTKEIGVSFTVAAPFETAINAIPDLEPGDVIIQNDPYIGSGGLCTHLPDINLLQPYFINGELACYIWSFIHSSDVGGIAPGSISSNATDVYQEGLRIPPLKLYKKGVLNDDVMAIFLANSRIPVPNRGDVNALVSAMTVAKTRLDETVDRYGAEKFRAAAEGLLDYAEECSRQVIADIPDGSYRFHDYLEVGGADSMPVRIAVCATVDGTDLTLDFNGTDPQVQAALNLTTNGQNHHFLTGGLAGFFLAANPSAPLNKGLWRPIHIKMPQATVLSPMAPAAVGVRFATGLRALETIIGALIQACDGDVPGGRAAGILPTGGSGICGVMAASVFDDETGEQVVNVVSPLIGGSGARPNLDGPDGGEVLAGFNRNVPVEALENELPLIMRHFRLADGPPKAGRTRGGLGLDFCLEATVPNTVIAARGMERNRFRPWARLGGEPGDLSRVIVNEGTEKEQRLPKIDVLRLFPGDTLRVISSAGAGMGNPLERDPQRVLADVRAGYVSRADAERVYGVVVTSEMLVDTERTAALRSASVEAPRAVFDFGPERRDFEELFSPKVHDAVLEALERRVSPHLRSYYLGEIYKTVVKDGGSEDIDSLLAIIP